MFNAKNKKTQQIEFRKKKNTNKRKKKVTKRQQRTQETLKSF